MSYGIPGSVATVLQMTSNSTECSSDTDRSTSAVVKGESSTPCSPPELDRVERMDVDEFGEVQIPADKHLSQWGVCMGKWYLYVAKVAHFISLAFS